MDHFPYWVPPASVSPTVGVPCVPQTMLGIVTSFFTAVGKMPSPPHPPPPPATHTGETVVV